MTASSNTHVRYKLACVPQAIEIQLDVLASLIRQARREPHIECCGVLAGNLGIITRAFPGANVADTPTTKYEIATREIINLMRDIRLAGLELMGIYHSHPNGKGEPSHTDIATVGYPDVAYFIISPAPDVETPVRAFWIHGRQVEELDLVAV